MRPRDLKIVSHITEAVKELKAGQTVTDPTFFF